MRCTTDLAKTMLTNTFPNHWIKNSFFRLFDQLSKRKVYVNAVLARSEYHWVFGTLLPAEAECNGELHAQKVGRAKWPIGAILTKKYDVPYNYQNRARIVALTDNDETE